MPDNYSKSYAERAVEHLVASTKRVSSTLFLLSFTYEAEKYQLVKWSSKKNRGVFPSALPSSAETVTVHDTSQQKVKCLTSRRTGSSLIYEENMVPYLLFFDGSQKKIAISPVAASYTFITELPYSIPLEPKNFTYLISLFQKQIVHWCFFFFVKNLKVNEISEKRLVQRFPALLSFALPERRACVEEAIHLFSMKMLMVFNQSILLRVNGSRLPVTPFLTPGEIVEEEAFERSLANCWMCCRRPVTVILNAFSTLSKKVMSGYEINSSLMRECVELVLGVVCFLLRSRRVADLVDLRTSFLFLRMNSLQRSELLELFRWKRSRYLQKESAIDFFSNLAMQNPFQLQSIATNDHSLDIYSLFTQAPEEETPIDDGPHLILRIDATYEAERVRTLPSSKSRKTFVKFDGPFAITSIDFEEFASCVSAKKESETLSLKLSRNRKERYSEEEALVAIRTRKRRGTS